MSTAPEQPIDIAKAVIRTASDMQAAETKVILTSLRPAEVANLLESNPPKVRGVLWELLDEEIRNQTLQHLAEEIRSEFLEEMDTEQLVAVADELDTDDFADLLQQLPQTITSQVLAALDARDRARVEAVLSYDEDSAGGLMNTDTVTIRPRHALELVFRYLRVGEIELKLRNTR